MGRRKIPIEELKHSHNRKVTFTKRSNGLMKKARELSILCDMDVFLLMFSPSGKPSHYLRETSNLEEVLTKFSSLTHQERFIRELESLEELKKTFKNVNHDVNINDFLKKSPESTKKRWLEDLQQEKEQIKSQVSTYKERISSYFGVDTSQINTLDQANNAEKTIEQALRRLRAYKMMQDQTQTGGIPTSNENHANLPTNSGCASKPPQLSSMPDERTLIVEDIPELPQGYVNYSSDGSVPASPGLVAHYDDNAIEDISDQQDLNTLIMQDQTQIGGIPTSSQNHANLPTNSGCASKSQQLSSIPEERTLIVEDIPELPQGSYVNYSSNRSVPASPGLMPHSDDNAIEDISDQQDLKGSFMEFEQQTQITWPENALYYISQIFDDGFDFSRLPGYENFHSNNSSFLSNNFHGFDSATPFTDMLNMAIQGQSPGVFKY